MSESVPADSVSAHRSLPERPDLERLRDEAKSLLDALRVNDARAIAHVAALVPHKSPPWQLADSQFAIARSYGFASWPKLVAHVETLQRKTDGDRVGGEFIAALAGDVATLRELLDREPRARELVNAPLPPFGARPVSRVTRDPEKLDLLIAHGADINLKSDWWAGPWGVLEMASPEEAELLISRGATVDIFAAAHLDRVDLLEQMLDADPSLVHARGGDGCTALHFAASERAIDLLLERGAAIDGRDVDHTSTPLQWMLPRPPKSALGTEIRPPGKLRLCRHLATRGARVDVFAAAAMDDRVRLQQLIDKDPAVVNARVNQPGYDACPVGPGGHVYSFTLGNGATPHAVAAAFGSSACLELLMERSSKPRAFASACAIGDRRLARDLLTRDPTLIDRLDVTDHALVAQAAWNGNDEAVILMLDLGFNPAAAGPDGGAALHAASWHGRGALVERILAHPAFLARQDVLLELKDPTYQATPLGWCCHGSLHCRNPEGDYGRVAAALRKAGAKIEGKDVASEPVKSALR